MKKVSDRKSLDKAARIVANRSRLGHELCYQNARDLHQIYDTWFSSKKKKVFEAWCLEHLMMRRRNVYKNLGVAELQNRLMESDPDLSVALGLPAETDYSEKINIDLSTTYADFSAGSCTILTFTKASIIAHEKLTASNLREILKRIDIHRCTEDELQLLVNEFTGEGRKDLQQLDFFSSLKLPAPDVILSKTAAHGEHIDPDLAGSYACAFLAGSVSNRDRLSSESRDQLVENLLISIDQLTDANISDLVKTVIQQQD